MKSNVCTKCLQHPEGIVLLNLSKRLCVSQMFTAASFQSSKCFGVPCWESFHDLCHRGCSRVLEGVSRSQREQDWWTRPDPVLSFNLEQTAVRGLHAWPKAGEVAQSRTCRAVEASGDHPLCQRGDSSEIILAWTHFLLLVGSCVSANTLPSAWLDPGRGFIAAAIPVGLAAPSRLFLCGAIAVKAGCQHSTCDCSAETWHWQFSGFHCTWCFLLKQWGLNA